MHEHEYEYDLYEFIRELMGWGPDEDETRPLIVRGSCD